MTQPQGSPSGPAKPSDEGFIDAHRHRIFLGLSIAGTLLLGPFAINNFFQQRLVLGVTTSAFVLCLVLNAWAIFRGRRMPVPPLAIFAAALLGLATAMYNNGLIGVLWVYPGILLFHFMLPRRQANLLNATLIGATIPLALLHLSPELVARVAVTLVLLVVFTNIFSRIAEVQHAKEVEQRERLDTLVHQLEDRNKALLEAARLREEVERIARHDLKTPLASIASVPRLLRERHTFPPEDDELLGTVERAALRVLSMVNLSLDLFRMEEGSYRLRAQAVDLGALARTVARELEAHARSKDVRLALDLPAQPLYAQGEDLLCYSTIANLLKNALEASPDGAEVRVRLWRASDGDGEFAALDIHNHGQVPPEIRERFFEKYVTHGKRGGTGLGAYSARLMARVQRGSLRMTSGPAGTLLALRLPLWFGAVPLASPSRAAPSPVPAGALPPLSVLVVDDDEYNVAVIRSLLPSPPLTVRTAVNGRAALESVRQARPDVIFLDVEMPVMGGLEAVRRIRELQREQGQRPSLVAAFSAHDDEATRLACLQAGFDMYLAKPSSREEVFAVLRGGGGSASPSAQAPAAEGGTALEPALQSLLPQFLASRKQLASELAAAADAGERETIRRTAHQLAGSLAMYGFKDASSASRALEQAAASEDLQALKARCAALDDLLARVQPPAVAGPVVG